MMDNKLRDKLVTFLRSPFSFALLIVAIISVVLLSLSVNKLRQVDSMYSYEPTYEYDPASETEIAFFPPTDGGDGIPSIYYVAENEVVDSGVPIQHWVVFKSVIEQYANENNIDLFRVSYLRDSYKLAATYVFDFKVVLNIDRQTIGVRIDSSKNWENILGSVYIFNDESGNELYRFEVTEENKCQVDGTCNSGAR